MKLKRSAGFGSYRSFPVLTTPGLHRTYLARIQYNGAQLAALDKAIVLVELTDGAQELKRSSSLVSASIKTAGCPHLTRESTWRNLCSGQKMSGGRSA